MNGKRASLVFVALVGFLPMAASPVAATPPLDDICDGSIAILVPIWFQDDQGLAQSHVYTDPQGCDHEGILVYHSQGSTSGDYLYYFNGVGVCNEVSCHPEE